MTNRDMNNTHRYRSSAYSDPDRQASVELAARLAAQKRAHELVRQYARRNPDHPDLPALRRAADEADERVREYRGDERKGN